MDQDIFTKKYPQTSPEVARMLGIGQDQAVASTGAHSAADLPVPGLPIAGEINQPAIHQPALVSHANTPPGHPEVKSVEEQASSQPAYKKVAKAILPYAAVFLVGVFLYYFFFTKVDFSTIFKSQSVAVTPQQSLDQQLEQQDAGAFNAWISSYYYSVSDPKILDPEVDNSGNGLTNFQKYLLGLNPKSYDTLGLGEADSQTIAKGINPLTGGPITDAQKTVVSKYVDMEVVMNRLTLSAMQNPPQVAGASTGAVNNTYGYNQNTPIVSQNLYSGGNTTITPSGANQVNINTSVPGLLEIPDLKIKAPIIWSQDPKNFDADLQSGVVHYPGTALPGEIGTTYIAGHSSNYPWAKGSYNQIFSTLGKLANNTSFKITITQPSGKTVTFDYIVVKSQQYSPTDQAQFTNTGKSLVALSTCWPVGSTAKRLVVFGELTQTEN